MTNSNDHSYVELTRISDPLQADLLAIFLDNAGLEFRMLGVRSAPILASLIPAAQEPIVFEVPEGELATGRELVTEYQLMQSREFVPSEFPPPYEGDDDAETTDDEPPAGDETDQSEA